MVLGMTMDWALAMATATVLVMARVLAMARAMGKNNSKKGENEMNKENDQNNNGVTASSLASGSLNQLIDEAFQKIWANIKDPNTEAKAVRLVTAKILFAPEDDRELVGVRIEVTTKLAHDRPVSSRIMLGFDEGVLVAEELRSKQTDIEQYVNNIIKMKGE